MNKHYLFLLSALAFGALSAGLTGCSKTDLTAGRDDDSAAGRVELEQVARMLSSLPLGTEQMTEVFDAVSHSGTNGYDSEYTMSDLFSSPGAGVGDKVLAKAGIETKAGLYSRPLRELISDALSGGKAGITGEDFSDLNPDALQDSDIQIYWPYGENWDGASLPVITSDPGDGSSSNTGWQMHRKADGTISAEPVVVTEEFARSRPVWVVNRNEDAGFPSLEILAQTGGGGIVIGGKAATKASAKTIRTLVLSNITMLRNYDNWFAGASELFFKIGAVKDFRVKDEDNPLQYNPEITDFMVVVRRDEVGKTKIINGIMLSDWVDELDCCGFMITEDDGGTMTSWKCSAVVKYNSKSFGVDLDLPFRSHDDIVWRGQLSKKYIDATSGISGRFGDLNLTFSVVKAGK